MKHRPSWALPRASRACCGWRWPRSPPKLGDVPHNLTLHVEQIEAARRQHADLIVFPELSLTGYFVRDMVPDLAISRPGARDSRN